MNEHIAGGIRPIYSRWVVTGEIVMDSAAHLGGQSTEDRADMVLIREEITGKPILPGTSLAGMLRGHLADRLTGYHENEHDDVSILFGGSREDDEGAQSPCVVFDSMAILPETSAVEIRDGVRIESQSGIAEESGKFDMELLPAGTRFPLRIEVIVPSRQKESKILSNLLTVLEDLEGGNLAIGAKTTRGLGRCHVSNWKTMRYDLGSSDGWMEWILSDHRNPNGQTTAYDKVADSFSTAWPHEIPKLPDERKHLILDLNLYIKAGILIRSPGVSPEDADLSHIKSGGTSVVPGTSLAGVIRLRAYRILQLLSDSSSTAQILIDDLFGPEGDKAQKSASRSRIEFSERPIEGGERLRPSRIQVDRFTAGVMKGALFDEEPHYKGKFNVRIELRNPAVGELGLLLLLAKDLVTGDLPIGGSTSVGRGYVEGKATFSGTEDVLEGCRGMISTDKSTINPIPANAAVERLVNKLKEEIKR